MKKLLILLPCVLGMLLAGCATPLIYDPATGTYYTQSWVVDPNTGQLVAVNTPVGAPGGPVVADGGDVAVADVGPVYYSDDGVDYYFVDGRYCYYRDHQRYFLDHLPRGGHYNPHHPAYASRNNPGAVNHGGHNAALNRSHTGITNNRNTLQRTQGPQHTQGLQRTQGLQQNRGRQQPVVQQKQAVRQNTQSTKGQKNQY